MNQQETITGELTTSWSIDLDWYQQNKRSFPVLARSYLCPKCAKRLDAKGKELSAKTILSAIKDCCSKQPGFFTDRLPIMESIFRLFLANGNKPLDLEELGRELSEQRGGDTYLTSAGILTHLLENDRFYGLQPYKR